jgi:hypothetical protein
MSKVSVSPASLPSKLAPFTGVNNGTARLLKGISAFELNSLREGDVVYTQSFRDMWKWLPTSVITSDDKTYCAPTVVGVGAGRFERLMWVSPDWNLQTEWHIASTGNDENSGLAGFPLLTTEERQRRWGGNFQLVANTAYHIRYLTDSYSDMIDFVAAANAVIYCHASVNDFEGVSPPLYTGTVAAIDVLNIATGQPPAITSNGLAVNWAGLIDARLRVTSGANIKALSSPNLQDSVTPKKAQCDEFLLGAASLSVAPFVAPASTQAPPIVGDTFVIESLRLVTRLHIAGKSPPGASNTSTKVILDGLQGALTGGFECGIYCYGCRMTTGFQAGGTLITFRSCLFSTGGIADTALKSIIGGHIVANGALVLVNNTPTTASIGNFTLQGSTSSIIFDGAGSGPSPDTWRPGQLGVYNHSGVAFGVYCPGVRLSASWNPYGTGNTGALIALMQSNTLIMQSGTLSPIAGFVTTSPNILLVSISDPVGLTSLPAFDRVTGLFTAARVLSGANIQATIAAGGFDYCVVDPRSGAGVIRY